MSDWVASGLAGALVWCWAGVRREIGSGNPLAEIAGIISQKVFGEWGLFQSSQGLKTELLPTLWLISE